jgi:hypothetical protein
MPERRRRGKRRVTGYQFSVAHARATAPMSSRVPHTSPHRLLDNHWEGQSAQEIRVISGTQSPRGTVAV